MKRNHFELAVPTTCDLTSIETIFHTLCTFSRFPRDTIGNGLISKGNNIFATAFFAVEREFCRTQFNGTLIPTSKRALIFYFRKFLPRDDVDDERMHDKGFTKAHKALGFHGPEATWLLL